MTFLAAAGAILGAAGSAFSAISQYQMAKYQQQVASVNARIADQNAKRTLQDSQIAERNQDMKNAALQGQQLAAQGASGISLENGTPLDIRASSAMLGRLDTLTVRNNAERTAYNYRVQQTNYEAQAKQAGMAASNSILSGFINTAGSLIGSASSNAPKWDPYKAEKIGTF